MLLAVAVLLLHSAAVPQSVISPLAASEPRSSVASSNAASATVPPELSPENVISPADADSTNPPILAEVDIPEFDTSDFSLAPAPAQPKPDSAYNLVAVTVIAVPADAPAPADPAAAAFVAVTPSSPAKDRAAEYRRKSYWLTLTVAQQLAATFDAWSTRHAVSNGGQELNPFLRPFAGNDSLFVAIQAGPVALDFLSHHMMNSNHTWVRRTWWVPQVAGTAVSIISGVHNLGVVAAP